MSLVVSHTRSKQNGVCGSLNERAMLSVHLSPEFQCSAIPTGGGKLHSGHSSLNVQCPLLMSPLRSQPNARVSLFPGIPGDSEWQQSLCKPILLAIHFDAATKKVVRRKQKLTP